MSFVRRLALGLLSVALLAGAAVAAGLRHARPVRRRRAQRHEASADPTPSPAGPGRAHRVRDLSRPQPSTTRAAGDGRPRRRSLPVPPLLAAGRRGRRGPRPAGPAQAAGLVLRRTSTATYGEVTAEAVRGFQEKRGFAVTGEVDRRTMERLVAMTSDADARRADNLGNIPGAARRRGADRPGDVRRQDQPHAALGDRRRGHQDHGRAVRRLGHADPGGLVHRRLQEPRPRLRALRHHDAVRDVLLRRPGRALLAGLRVGRLRRRLARLRQRARLRRASPGCSTRSRSATRSSSTGPDGPDLRWLLPATPPISTRTRVTTRAPTGSRNARTSRPSLQPDRGEPRRWTRPMRPPLDAEDGDQGTEQREAGGVRSGDPENDRQDRRAGVDLHVDELGAVRGRRPGLEGRAARDGEGDEHEDDGGR